MASGKSHDLAIAIVFPVVLAGACTYLPSVLPHPLVPVVAIVSYLAGGIWLSPDIDLPRSRPSQRLGVLSFLWQPYRAASGHRGFSHIPAIGTMSRIFYVCIPVLLWMLATSHNPTPLLWQHREISIALFMGLEISCIVHLVMDYTPGLNRT